MDPQPPSSKSALRRSIPAAAFLLLLCAVYADPLFTGRNFSGRDLLPYGLPMERTIHDAWSRGRVPVWAEDLSGGRPVFPNPNTGTLYPVRPLLARLPFPLAMRLFPVVHWAIAGVGMLLLLEALSASAAAAWVGAATFVFSGVGISQVFYQPFGPAVSMHPWLLWALVRPAAPRRKAVVLGVVWGLVFLLGDVIAVGIGLLASGLWILLGAAREERARSAGVLAAGLGLGALVAAPQIVATALLVPETQRAVTAIPLEEVLRFTLSPWRLAELVVPFPFGDVWTLEDHSVWARASLAFFYQTIYCGAFALVALALVARSRDRVSRFCVALFGAGVGLAIAGVFVPAAWRARPSPIPLRYPEKFAVVVTLALALAAGLAFDRLRRGEGARRWPLAVAAALAIAAAAASVFPARVAAMAVASLGADKGADVRSEAAEQIAPALAEGALLWAATFLAIGLAREPGAAPVLASLAILTAVPLAANRRIVRTEHPAALFGETAFARAVERRDPARAYRTIDEAMYRPPSRLQLEGNRASPWGTELTRRRWGYHAQALWSRGTVFNVDVDRGDFSRLDSLRQVSVFAATQPDGAAFFASLSLRFGVRFRDQEALPGFSPFGGDAFMDWDENTGALPDIRLASRWREASAAVEALRILPGLAADEVVLETGRSGAGASPPGLVRVLERSPERLRLATSCPGAAWLFVLRGFWEHRTIRVDGAAVDGVPAQLAFTAVPVPAGDHAIEWREEIPGFSASRWGPALFAILAALLWFSDARRMRARRS